MPRPGVWVKVDVQDAERPARARPDLSLRARALKYLAAREHSRLELARKLGPHAESPEQLAALLDEFEQRDLLSATRFAESVVHRKAARLGLARIQAELQQHQLPEGVAEAALHTLQGSELSRAQALWAQRFGAAPESLQERARQYRFMASRGFSGEVIRQVLKDATPKS